MSTEWKVVQLPDREYVCADSGPSDSGFVRGWNACLARVAAPTEGAPVLIDAEELAGLRRDAARLDFLESLMKRTGVFGHKQTVWPLDTDMHIGSRGVSIYARTGIGSNTEFSVGGATVREAIDAALAANGEKVG